MTELERLAERLDPRPAGRCLIGLSGGADSVALACMLALLRDAGEIQPEAAHVNHGLRGAESDGDEEFVRGLCGRLGIPLWTERLCLNGRRDENSARDGRYAAFRRILREREIPTLVLAHQRDDQAETFLIRLLRGAGPDGLSGMKREEKREGWTLIRPMLGIGGQELRGALRKDGIPWREDGSNQDRTYLRNRIRLELIPMMEELAPGAAVRAARAAELIGRDQGALAAEAEETLRRCEMPGGLDTAILRDAPEALRGRILRLWWRRNGPTLEERELSFDQTRRLEGLLDAPRGTIINLPGGWRARREKQCLRLMDPQDRTKNNRPRRGEKSRSSND